MLLLYLVWPINCDHRNGSAFLNLYLLQLKALSKKQVFIIDFYISWLLCVPSLYFRVVCR